jgi:isoquinoline 1-oxidoreductase beta subunit
MSYIEVSRRTFVKTAVAAGGGMALGFFVPGLPKALAATTTASPWVEGEGVEVNAWLTIDENSIVNIRCPHTEMGQGALTSVAIMIAEELDVPWENVRSVMASANRHVAEGEVYVSMSTGGSALVRRRHTHIMQAGASARERLKQAAADAWGVDRTAVTAKQGMLNAGSNSATYGEFATAAAAVTLAEEPAIKAYGDWWLVGSAIPRVDVEHKVDGSAIYPIDVRLDGMVYAAVQACPVPQGKLMSYDFDAVKDRPGVIAAVELPQVAEELANSDMRSGVAVVADTYYRAKTALSLMPIEWDYGPGADNSYDKMTAAAQNLLGKEAEHAEEVRGDPRPILASATNVVTGDYSRPFEAHATMCPPSAVANVTADRVDVWSFTQNVSSTLLLAAEQAGRDPKDVYVHACYQGGAFGNGNQTDVPRQAVEISKQIGRPVNVTWAREDEIMQDRSRPPVWARFSAEIGDDGLPTAMLSRAVGESLRGRYADRNIANMPYQVPNYRYERHEVYNHIPIGPHRAPGANNNVFCIEQFVDEMALAAGWDPLEWRIKMTVGNEPWQRVLLKIKEVSGWTTDLPKGQGMGIGIAEDHGSIVGTVATVEVTRRGRLFVDKVLVVSNSGYVLNTLGSEEQCFSGVGWELSHVLNGGLGMENGCFTNANFDNYHMLRMSDMPEVETVFALSEDGWWGGYGEPSGPPTPAAVGNAIYFASGKRVRTTPILQYDLSWA